MVGICIGRFSKMIQLVPLSESNTCTIAEKFINTVAS